MDVYINYQIATSQVKQIPNNNKKLDASCSDKKTTKKLDYIIVVQEKDKHEEASNKS